MSAFTIEKANNLYWLGRYIERVFISITAYQDIFDRIIDGDEHAYHDYCKQLDIDDFYLNDAHFVTSYLYDRDNPDSLISNLLRAYDNAIVLREEITSATLSYIQLACNAFEKNIIKCGKYVEQVDLCFRLAYDRQDLEKSISRLNNRILQIQKILELDDPNQLLVDETMNYLDFINKLN
ncbi:alpha-E domain-containing protein, partial [Thomasclavelia sp.]|uniref:alpha-E domain-containing protein n=1 Tax=Thomasclavelia sp. TaxID=3025757 RepID=UPI0025CF97AB